jgi:hypothetical protein
VTLTSQKTRFATSSGSAASWSCFPTHPKAYRVLAAVAVIRGDYDRAARLLGAAAEDRRDRPEDPVEARLDTTFFEPARARRGPDAWDAAARDGRTLSFDDAIAYALQEPRE